MLDVRRGRLALNGGLLQADTLVMTNTCGLFFRGGTLMVGSVILDPITATRAGPQVPPYATIASANSRNPQPCVSRPNEPSTSGRVTGLLWA